MRVLEGVLEYTAPDDDVFYQNSDPSLDFFISLQEFNQRLMQDPDFGVLLTGFAPRLLPITGSRPRTRQSERRGEERPVATQIRAIVQNGILHQLGWPATVTFGVGAACARDREWIGEALPQSQRLNDLLTMVFAARTLGDTDITLAYLELYNPLFWLRLAKHLPDQWSRAARHVARLLAPHTYYTRAARSAQHLIHDQLRLDEALASFGNNLHLPHAASFHPEPELLGLHQQRITLMIKLFLQITLLPAFSSNPQMRVEDVMHACLFLDIDNAMDTLYKAFPADTTDADDTENEDHDYRKEHRQLFAPIQTLYQQIRQITLALVHAHGAFG